MIVETPMHSITINVPDRTYNTAKEKAASQGYLSVEEYLSDWLEADASFEIRMTPQLADALEEGLADVREGQGVTLEEHNIHHAQRRAAWIQAHSS